MMIQKKSLRIYHILLLFLIWGCSVRKERALFTSPSDFSTDTIRNVYVINDKGINDAYYKIKTDDRIAIQNVQNSEFGATNSAANGASTIANSGGSGTGSGQNVLSYPVEPDGNVNLPAIGKVAVLGLTRREAGNKIQELYKGKLLKDPIIQLNVINLKVTLLGEFGRQGNFYLDRDNVNLIEIIGEAGGITKTADPKSLKIIRGDRSNPEIIYVNLTDVNSLASKKLILQNNDIITLLPTKSAAFSEKWTSINNFIQPVLVVVNLGILILSLTR